MNATNAFETYHNMLYQIVWKHAKKSFIPFEELLGESYIAFSETIKTYQKEKGSLSTHLHCGINGRIRNHIVRDIYKKESRYKKRNLEKMFVPEALSDRGFSESLEDKISTLSNETQKVIDIILQHKEKLYNTLTKKSVTKLLLQHNMAWSNIRNAYKELSLLF